MPVTASLAPTEAPRARGGTKPAKAGIREAALGRILDAAEGVFARTGFTGATTAEIAAQAGCSKANVHYYFRTKEDLYRAVLDRILALWLAETDGIRADADPAEALGHYIRAKMRLAAERPDASRVFANELLHGAPQIGPYLRTGLKRLVDEKSGVIEAWIAQGRMAPLDPRHLFFTLWASTQTYADFAPQIRAVLGSRRDTPAEHAHATEQLVGLVLRGCGIEPAVRRQEPAPVS